MINVNHILTTLGNAIPKYNRNQVFKLPYLWAYEMKMAYYHGITFNQIIA